MRILPTLVLLAASTALAGTIVLEPTKDVTLIEHPAGERANGSGPNFFAGRTSEVEGSLRRALVEFDLSSIPAGATIVDAVLTLTMNQGNSEPLRVSLHRIEAEWSEGPSSTPGGIGAPAEPGDATWIHTLFDSGFWGSPGGDVVASSASAVVGGPDVYTWSSPAMIDDVQRWSSDPSSNHGWLLRGDEASGSTSKRFNSREHADPARRPSLLVTFVARGAGDDEDEEDDECTEDRR